MPDIYKPSQVAALLGVHVNTVRLWHKQGLLTSSHATAGGHRRYSAEDVAKFKMRFGETK